MVKHRWTAPGSIEDLHEQALIEDASRSAWVACWCGQTVREGRLHYPANDPEYGPAHRPVPRATPACESCGGPRPGVAVEIPHPGGLAPWKATLCPDCSTYWQSADGQAEILRDEIEDAERKAGWDPNP